MFIDNETLHSIIRVPSTSGDFLFAETTLRGIIRDSETLSEINMKAGREYLALVEEGRHRVAELFDNLAFWAFEEMERVPTVPR